jgi:phosphoglycolate phosphatase
MSYKLVIFDLDGTLVDSIEGIKFSMNRVLDRFNFPNHDTDTYKNLVGNGLRNLVSKALPPDFSDLEMVEKCYELMLEEYGKNWDREMELYDGIEAVLDELSKKNIKLAINTNKNQEMTDEIVERYLSNWDFIRVIGFNSDFPKKPDPYGVNQIMEKADVTAEECVYIGDSEVDIQTAINADISCVSVSWGFRTKEQLEKYSPNTILDTPLGLLDLLI